MPKNISMNQIHAFQDKLLEWYDRNGRTFPWRRKSLSHYQYIIAEVLLQRTKAETVSKFYMQFVRDFPNWKALVEADVKQVEKYLVPVGLYRQRSKRLKNLAAEMVKRGGRLPRDRADLESIPFIGQYIANAIELIIFHEPSPLIDVNMSRVLERVFGAREMADIRYDPYLQKLSYRIVNHERAREINWAILDHAALVCTARLPRCGICPISKMCQFYLLNRYVNRVPANPKNI